MSEEARVFMYLHIRNGSDDDDYYSSCSNNGRNCVLLVWSLTELNM